MHVQRNSVKQNSYQKFNFPSQILLAVIAITTTKFKQECIPVGCVAPAAVAIHMGGLPQCMLGYTPPWVWAWRPPWVWAWRPPGCGPGEPPGCGPGDPMGVGQETPRPGDPPGVDLENRITDTCKNITLPQLRCGR